ncbi:hypothetical protein CKM354_000223700 [Cercospora kikuchii]|uniref:Heterokaryon incompatibility domain-containing protein n=1 Tax=Cercospora kikuchii TaxID=84275 RepID=A0A9P3F929_9PEZI|nr:uncharacterized protein CKM354_000223700 [Cercospora kikuchii]GIZ38836.1 hypothetical protein CKM354_000223700 [Cercospora kikuchii]
MRLINIDTLTLHEYASAEDAPPYIITSHRWLNGEVSFQEVLRHDRDSLISGKAGMRKIKAFCDFVKLWRFSYSRPGQPSEPLQIIPSHIWIDTCCINKESSAELQEAITSMFQWYRQAWCCLAFLHDVETASHCPLDVLRSLEQSVWFTRGWTLQELLAPKYVVFLDASWAIIGHKSHHKPLMTLSDRAVTWQDLKLPLNNYLSQITNIDERILWDYAYANDVTFEERLSWMLRRTTTRPEDRAYCMLGVCEIYMPLIYGEGKNAMKRLYREIRAEHGITVKDSGQVPVPQLTPHERGLHAMTFGSLSAEQAPQAPQPPPELEHEATLPPVAADATDIDSERTHQVLEALHEYFSRVRTGHVWADDRGFVNVSDIMSGSRLKNRNVTFDELVAVLRSPAGRSFQIQPTAFANEFSYSPADFEIKLRDGTDDAELERSQSAPGGSSWLPLSADPWSQTLQPAPVHTPYKSFAPASVPPNGNGTDYAAMINALDYYFARNVDYNHTRIASEGFGDSEDLLQDLDLKKRIPTVEHLVAALQSPGGQRFEMRPATGSTSLGTSAKRFQIRRLSDGHRNLVMKNNSSTGPAPAPARTVGTLSAKSLVVKHALDSYFALIESGIIRADGEGFANVGKMMNHRLFNEAGIRLDDITKYIEADAGQQFEKKEPLGRGNERDFQHCFLRKKQVQSPPKTNYTAHRG